MRRVLGGLLVLPALGGFLPPAVRASEAPVFSVDPVGTAGYYRLAATPGSVMHRQVRVVNAGRVMGIAELFAVDATTGTTTGAVYKTPGSRRSGVGAWIRLSGRRLRLSPGASRLVDFDIVVPAQARGGEHLGGLVVRPLVRAGQPKHEPSKQRRFRIDLAGQAIVGVQVTLPGGTSGKLAVGTVGYRADPSGAMLTVELSNAGDRMVHGRGVVELTDDLGGRPQTVPFSIDTFLPRSRIALPLHLEAPLASGSYRARAQVRWPSGTDERTSSFTATTTETTQSYGSPLPARAPASTHPSARTTWWLIATGVVLLLVAGAAVTWKLRRRLRHLEQQASAAFPDIDFRLRDGDDELERADADRSLAARP